MKISGDAHSPETSNVNRNPAIRIAMLAKAKDAQKAEGEAALKLIEAGESRTERRDESRGRNVDRYA